MTDRIVTPATLAPVYAAAGPGDTLRLQPGAYPKAGFGRALTKPITVTAADPASPPRFTQTMILRGVKGLRLVGVDIDVTGSLQGLRCYSGSDVEITGGRTYGTPNAAGERAGSGLMLQNAERLRIRGMLFRDLHTGATIGPANEVSVLDCDFLGMGSDGVQFSNVQGIDIVRNLFDGFVPRPGAHPDAIQGFTLEKDGASTDVNIHDNAIRCGTKAGDAAQGIFITSGFARLRRVRVGGNLLVNTGYNGLMVSGADDVEIEGNKVLFVGFATPVAGRAAGSTETWIRADAVTGLKMARNEAMKFVLPAGVALGDNAKTRPVSAKVAAAAWEAWLAKHRAGNDPKSSTKRPGRRAAFEAWDQKLAEMGDIADFLRGRHV